MDAKRKNLHPLNSKRVKPLSTEASFDEAFLFFTDIGQYTGENATSIPDLYTKLARVSLKSIEFHFQRSDFERWILEILQDQNLATTLQKLDKTLQGENLRTVLQRIVKEYLNTQISKHTKSSASINRHQKPSQR